MMTTATLAAAPALAPVQTALARVRERRGSTGTAGLLPGLVAPEAPGWVPAGELVDGVRLDHLLTAAAAHWDAPPHVAAALAWRSYTYWLAMPAVLGWATARRLPLLAPDNLRVRYGGQEPFLTLGLRRPSVAVLPDDPLAGTAGVTVAAGERELLELLRLMLREGHLEPLLAQVQQRVRLGARTLWGSLASAVAYAAVRGLGRTAEGVLAVTDTILPALGVADLVSVTAGPDGWPAVQRRTCCLAFTLPEPKVCSGCCLRSPGT